MNWSVWSRVEKIVLEFDVKPIMAVVPDNQDKTLKVSEPNPEFWSEVRAWQGRGWPIGMHGYQHVFATRDPGIIGINKFSEFSGLSFQEQMDKIRCSLGIFERERVKPEVWVAPAHSYDGTTETALQLAGIKYISDGLHLFPRLNSCGMLAVPQQFWRFRWMPLGVWTICQHFNSWTEKHLAQFRADIERFRSNLVDFKEIVAAYSGCKGTWWDEVYAPLHLAALKISRSGLLRR
jgi:predicted deacetylase